MDQSLVLVLGASGYVGGRLVPQLLAAGHRVRCLARSPRKLAGAPWVEQVEVVEGDLLDAESLPAAFEGAHAVVHLVHMMGTNPDFERADRTAARHVAQAAADAGVRRIVYLGGLGEDGEATSPHLRSRAEVGRILLASRVPTTVLRAAVIVGSGSASFEMLRHLVEKLPVMVTPRWINTRVQPIAIRDVLRYLVAAVGQGDGRDHVYDIGGPDVLTYAEMMRRYARVAGLPPRLILRVPVLTPSLSSYWVNLVTPVPFGLARPLVSSLSVEVVARPGREDIRELAPGPLVPTRRRWRWPSDVWGTATWPPRGARRAMPPSRTRATRSGPVARCSRTPARSPSTPATRTCSRPSWVSAGIVGGRPMPGHGGCVGSWTGS